MAKKPRKRKSAKQIEREIDALAARLFGQNITTTEFEVITSKIRACEMKLICLQNPVSLEKETVKQSLAVHSYIYGLL